MTRAPERARSPDATRAQLVRAGEQLFAERGIHQVRLREINALAGQKNRSALHYHFGTRQGLVEAILSSHQTAMDAEVGPALDALVARGDPTVRDVVAVWVQALSGQLRERSGRDFLRIVPQVLDMVNPIVRRGATVRASTQSGRTFALLDQCMAELPTPVRRERLVAYSLILTALFADRAALVESGDDIALDDDAFAAHALDVICGAVTAPSSVDTVR
jgi:AcrR family transcriptional regulator